jgi:chemotaxis protein methyltransferase CheR
MSLLTGLPTAAPAQDREFDFSSGDFERVRKLIYAHAGIALAPVKQDMVYSRLSRRLRHHGDRSFAQYLARLEADPAEREAFVNALTTNLTAFFREAHHFELLRERLQRLGAGRVIKIWCAAASTGEEAYTLAITACEAFNSLQPPVHILASDIDTQVLAQGARGVYALERAGHLAPERLRRFFLPAPEAEPGALRVRPELQRLISFRRINLLDAHWPVPGPLDAIFCRNVMIYFDRPTQHAVLRRFAPLLRDDGLLFAGHSESLVHAAELFRSLGRTVYEKAHGRPG